jgi:hypothetical protein|tara:strand:- start:2391 stop:2585 length:195 start_codon:yes stop_codon:yes gene_type:complete
MTELDLIEKKLDDHEKHYGAALLRGTCKDFGEYQRICGVIHGLNLAKTDLQDLRTKLEKQDNDD